MALMTITVEDYRTDPTKRQIADAVVEKGRLDKNQAFLIIECEDHWKVRSYRTRNGKRYFMHNGLLSTKTATIPKEKE